MNMTAEVDDTIPIPDRCKYPWRKLRVKQSFHVPGTGERFIKQMRVQAARAGKRYKRKFITRPDDTGIRIWRQQ